MTLNATDRILFAAVDTGKLVRWEPIRPAEARSIYVTPAVLTILEGDDPCFPSPPVKETETLMGRFCLGHLVTVSMIGLSTRKPDFEKLTDLDEVWALCARRPLMSQIRLFGRFIDQGVFVCLSFYERGFLGFWDTYNELASQTPNDWSQIFGTLSPFRGVTADDYFGYVVRDVDV